MTLLGVGYLEEGRVYGVVRYLGVQYPGSRVWNTVSRDRYIPKDTLHPPELRKEVVHILLECFLVVIAVPFLSNYFTFPN